MHDGNLCLAETFVPVLVTLINLQSHNSVRKIGFKIIFLKKVDLFKFKVFAVVTFID